MEKVFDIAIKELTAEQLNKWIFFAYGVLESNATESQKELLLKGIEQDKKQGEKK